MLVTCVTVYVKPEHVEEFIQAAVANHRASVQEPGNMRFDVLQSTEDPTRFMLYEAYESEESSAAHKQTPHYLLWRETVKDWMAQPRVGVPYCVLAPSERRQW